jgi:hypothetical protein
MPTHADDQTDMKTGKIGLPVFQVPRYWLLPNLVLGSLGMTLGSFALQLPILAQTVIKEPVALRKTKEFKFVASMGNATVGALYRILLKQGVQERADLDR